MSDRGAYRAAGVDYSVLDRAKREAMTKAAATASALAAHLGREFPESRGASAFVFELGGQTLALVIEGLGTKALIADEYLARTGETRYADIAIDAVAAIVNDVISVGAVPVVVSAYFATGSADWYEDPRRSLELIAGWQRGCVLAGATWGGGESPALPGLVAEGAIELAGTAIGRIPDGRRPVLGEDIEPGDAIIFLTSSGLHANGASLARKIARQLPGGLLTELPSGRRFGDALLDPAALYAGFVSELLTSPVVPRFLNAITGHGLQKVMRSPIPMRYVINELPPVPEVLELIVREASMSPAEAYSTINMGAGFVVVVDPDDVDVTLRIAQASGHGAVLAGRTEPGRRSVEIVPLAVSYEGDPASR